MTPVRAPLARSEPGARQANLGFTMIELMTVVAIMAILLALAGPSFTPLIERWRVRDSAETLTSTLYYARSEAIIGQHVEADKYEKALAMLESEVKECTR